MRHLVEEMTTFAMVAKTNSFTKAAQQLGKSKTYVSLQVSRLEEAIGLQLLFRTTRHLELTEAGRSYVDYCYQILNTIDEASQAVDVLKGSMRGVIKLTVPVSFGKVFLDDIISGFQLLYPQIQVLLELDNKVQNLKEAEMDMAIRMSTQLNDDLVAICIGELCTPIYASPDYLSQMGTPNLPEELSRYDAILHSKTDRDHHWSLMVNGHVQRIKLSWKLSINNYLLIRDAALESKGLAKLPTYLVKDDVKQGRLVPVLEDFQMSGQPIYLVYDYQGALPLKNRVFIDYVKAWFADHEI